MNIVCSLVLFSLLRPSGFGHVGIALATAVAAWVNVALLWRGLGGFVRIRRRDRRKLRRIVVASLLMGVVTWGGARALAPWFAAETGLRLLALALVVGLGLAVYGFLVLALRATTIGELREGFGK